MISRGVEISIAGGGGEMVRGLPLGRFFFFLFCNQIVIMFKGMPTPWSEPSALYRHLLTTLTLVTHHLALHNPL